MPERTDRIGQRYGDYWLRHRLGKGSFGDVYLGEHVHNQTLAAVKVLHIYLTHPDDLRTFLNEVRIFRLQHPHIVRLLDVGVAPDDAPFLIMEYAPGGTLRDRHPRGTRLPLQTILSYITPIASALQYAHDQHLIHRDVKPANMLLGTNGTLLLSDFGIATMTHNSLSLVTENLEGTLPYMAPEQLHGKPRPQSDQYALAVVVYQWLTGTWPFQGTSIEIASQHQITPPPSLRTIVPNLPSEIEQVIFTALAKDPHHRFDRIQTFATTLEQAIQTSLQQTRSLAQQKATSPVQSVRKEATSKKESSKKEALPFSYLPGSFSESSTGPQPESSTGPLFDPSTGSQLEPPTASFYGSSTGLQPEPSTASLHESSKTESISEVAPYLSLLSPEKSALPAASFLTSQNPALNLLSDLSVTNKSAEATKPQKKSGPVLSRRLLLVSGASVLVLASGGVFLWSVSRRSLSQPLLRQNTPQKVPLYLYQQPAQGVHALAWSPDGTHLALGIRKLVQIWNATNGSHLFTYKGHTALVNAVTWSPDGKRIASASADKTVQVWDAVNGAAAFTYQGHSDLVRAVAWSPDSKRIASASKDKTVQVWNATDGSNGLIYKGHAEAVRALAWSPDSTRLASGSVDKTVQIWNATNGNAIFTYQGHTKVVNAVAWSPDGTRLASGSVDKTVQIWNATNSNTLFTYQGHTNIVNIVIWSPDSKRIASASNDATVQIWNAADGSHPSTYQENTLALVWSPNSKYIALSSPSAVQLWPAAAL